MCISADVANDGEGGNDGEANINREPATHHGLCIMHVTKTMFQQKHACSCNATLMPALMCIQQSLLHPFNVLKRMLQRDEKQNQN